MELTKQQVDTLFGLVKQAIIQGLQSSDNDVDFAKLEQETGLSAKAATFVTLHLHNQLRGCIGTLEAYRPIAQDVFANAYSAAFRDPRFMPLSESEQEGLDIELSVLTEPEPIKDCLSKKDLINQLVPYEDGLILTDGRHRATFLPSVWEQIEDKEMFINHLMRKAGISYWSDRISCQRYHVKAYGRKWQEIE